MFDINEVASLLHIHEKASAHGSVLKNISDAALKELRKINELNAPQSPAQGIASIPAEDVLSDPPPEETPPLRREGL